MKGRCTNPENPKFETYGARGISVCDRWLNSFQNFLDDMGKKPTSRHTIERIDNNGNYTKENCRWATNKEQANNRRSNRILIFNGQRRNMKQWAKKMGMTYSTLKSRFNYGWSVAEALTRPVGAR